MATSIINNTEDLRRWFHRSGVLEPLQTCIGPLPSSNASLARWSSDIPDEQIHTMSPHPGCYRVAVMLAPLEARIWNGADPVWGGMIGANRFRICPPEESGRWRRTSACDIVNIFLPIAMVDQFAHLRGDVGHIALAGNLFTPDRYVIDLVHKMLDAEILAGPLAAQVCDSLMTILVSYFLEHYTQPISQGKMSSLAGARLRKVLAYIALNTSTLVSNAELAALCHMSEAHFSREFRRAMGLPPHQYSMKLRLEHACQILISEETRIVDIAYECGFNNASHFSRSFASHYGMPPALFRVHKRQSN